jgi:RsiW-degrading membrane proteinase PrsW (M82 family)
VFARDVSKDAAYNEPMRWLVILCLVAIVISMASALYFMYRDGNKAGAGGHRMFRALALRVGLSVGLFIFLMVAYKLGYIGPKGVGS